MNSLSRLASLFAMVAGVLLVTTGASCRASGEPPALNSVAASLQHATVRIVAGNDRSSGVIVTADGRVLTVAHGLPSSDRPVRVVLHDGTQREAIVLASDTNRDVALLKLAPGSSQPVPLRLAVNGTPTVSDVVLACGCPGREADGLSSVIRRGRITAETAGSLRSTCALTVGDSGGPLVNSAGELIGLNRRIGASSAHNLHIPLSVCLEAVGAQQGNELAGQRQPQRVAPAELQSTEAARAAVQRYAATLTFRDTWSGELAIERRIAATRISQYTVVSKASLTADLQTVEVSFATDSRTAVLRRLAVRECVIRESDLAVWHMEGAAAEMDPDCLPTGGAQVAMLAFATNANQPGIIARVRHTEPPLPLQFGCALAEHADQGLEVLETIPNSAGRDAGLRKGDILFSLNDNSVRALDDFAVQLKPYQPGDWARLGYQRGENTLRGSGRFRLAPAQQLARQEYLDGRVGEISQRRSGFPDVIQHDLPVLPEDCGGPLVDSHGQLIGVNIARRSRESTLALPIATVQNLVNRE